MKMKDRLEYPIDFLESMLENYTGEFSYRTKAFVLTTDLMQLIKASDIAGIRSWLRNISFDPEELGSAFVQIYRFAGDYAMKLESMANQSVQRDAGSAGDPDA